MVKVSRSQLDLAMVIGLLGCMCYPLIGAAWHEWLGTAVLAAFVWHVVRNRRWFGALRRGQWRAGRVFATLLDGLIAFTTLGLVASSLMLSEYVFAFLPLDLPAGTGLTPHQVCAYWGFLLMALHLGQHGGVWTAKGRAFFAGSKGRWLAAALVAAGAAAFWLQGWGAQLFLQTREPAPVGGLAGLFLSDALLFAACVCVGRGLHGWLARR